MKAAAVRVVPIPRRLRSDLLRLYTAVLAATDGRDQTICRSVLPVGIEQLLDRNTGRNLAAEMSAHTVSDGRQVARREGDVLIGGPQITGIGRGRRPQSGSSGDLEDRAADLHTVAPAQPGRNIQALVVQEGAVGGSEVLDPQLSAAPEDAGRGSRRRRCRRPGERHSRANDRR